MGDTGSLGAIVCASDAMVRDTVAAAVRQAGYDLRGETSSGADAFALAGMVEPDLIVIDNELGSRAGLEWAADLHDAHPLAAILLIATDPHIRERAVERGVFGVVYRSNLGEISGALARAEAWLLDPDLHTEGERRTGRDRRQKQDWNKVTSERRSGVDRRQRDRGGPPAPTG